MRLMLLVGITLEGIVLLLLAVLKKLTRKIFSLIMGITLLFSILFIGIELYDAKVNDIANQRESLYIAARLLEEEYNEDAMEAFAPIVDEECMEYYVQSLRGLVLNQNEYYETASLYLEDMEDEYAKKVYESSIVSCLVEETDKVDIIERTLKSLNVSEAEKESWEVKMKLLYIEQNFEQIFTEENTDVLSYVKASIEEHKYVEAFETMKKAAQVGGVKEDILLSNMYVQNYNLRTMEEDDAEYDAIWEEMTYLHAEMNLLSVELKKEREKTDKTEEENERFEELQKKYNNLSAQYSLVLKDRTKETVGRALNYLKTSEPENADSNLAYQLQLSYLYYLSMQEDLSKECLDKIFAVEVIDRHQWLGVDIHLFRESYLHFLSDGNKSEYKQIFYQMMNHLYQGIFDFSDSSYEKFVTEYLETLFAGIVIADVNKNDFPQMEVNVVCINEELELNKENLILSDTETIIEEFEIVEKEVTDLSLCFVLDRSGSMSGNSIRDAKNAIKECVMSLDEYVEVSMVSFDSDAVADCALTFSNYLILNKLNTIEANGGTDIVAGLEKGYEVLNNASGKRVVILLSDGASGDTGLDEVLAKYKSANIECYVIGMQGSDENYLKRVANGTNGKYISASDSATLGKIYREIQESLTHIYTITYMNSETDMELRNVKINYEDTLIQTKKKYRLNEVEEKEEINLYVEEDQSSDYFKQTGGLKKEERE